jgi:hypothetical protein
MDALQGRLRTLAELVAHAALVTRPEQACARALESLARASSELEWAGIYLIDLDGNLHHAGGTETMQPGAATDLPLAEGLGAARPIWVEHRSTVLVPLRAAVDGPSLGVLVVGLDPGLGRGEELLGFLMQVGQTIGAAVAIAQFRTQAEKHLQVVAFQDQALQTFFVIGLLARAALADLAPDQVSDDVATTLVQIVNAAETGREQLREAVRALGQPEIGRGGLVEDLGVLVRNFHQRTGIDAELIVTGRAANDLPADAIDTLHHAAAEALANIERQAQARAVVLSLHIARNSVSLFIHDDGAGITPSSATDFGLRGVGMRVRHLGGTFDAQPTRDGGGFVVRTRIPLREG